MVLLFSGSHWLFISREVPQSRKSLRGFVLGLLLFFSHDWKFYKSFYFVNFKILDINLQELNKFVGLHLYKCASMKAVS